MLHNWIDINDRCYIIGALGHFKDPKAFEPLKTVLRHENEYLRCFAARALAEYGDVSVMPSIFDALSNVNRRWWYGTTESIGEIVKLIKKKSIENGRESEFETYLTQMELRHKEMVAEYRKWSGSSWNCRTNDDRDDKHAACPICVYPDRQAA